MKRPVRPIALAIRPHRRLLRPLVAASLAVVAVASFGIPAAQADAASPVPTTVAIVSGDGQSAQAGEPFDAPLIAEVLDQDGNPMEGVEVVLSASGPAEFASGATSTVISAADGSVDSGVVSALDGTGAVTVTATALGGTSPSATFHLTVGPRTARLLEVVSGDAQSTIFGYAFSEPLVVRAEDALGNPIQPPGATVRFTVASGGSYFVGGTTTATAEIEADGSATSPALLPGSEAGPIEVTAEIVDTNGSVGATSFHLTVGAPAPTTLTTVSGDDQRTVAGSVFAESLVAQVRDQRGNPVDGASVTFAVSGPARFPTGTTSVVSADASGTATAARLTASAHAVGAVTVTATASGGSNPTATFDLAVTSPVATAIEIVGGDQQATYDGLVLGAPLVVRALDASGNPVQPVGATVTFEIQTDNAQFRYSENDAPPSGGVVANDAGTPTTYTAGVDAQGNAATPGMVLYPTLGPGQNGVVEVSATIADGNGSQGSAEFQLYIMSGPPAAVTIVSGGGQTATAGAAFEAPVVAEVTDSNGFPVVGAPVLMQVASGPALMVDGPGCEGDGDGCIFVTDHDGQVSADVQAGSVTGTSTIDVAALGGSNASTQFSLTVTAPTGSISDPEATTTQPPTPSTSTPPSPAPGRLQVRAAAPSTDAPTPVPRPSSEPSGELARTGPVTSLPVLVAVAVGLLAAGAILRQRAMRLAGGSRAGARRDLRARWWTSALVSTVEDAS